MTTSYFTSESWREPAITIHPIECLTHDRTYSGKIQCSFEKFTIVWIQSGTGIFYNRTVASVIHTNSIFCLIDVEQKIILDADAKGFVISFPSDFLATGDLEFGSSYFFHTFKRFSRTCGLPVTGLLEADLMEFATRMINENTNTWAFKMDMLKRYLKIFVVYLIREVELVLEPVAQTKKTEHVEKFLELLEQHFKTKKMVCDYADMLYVSPNYLNEIVKNITGSPASYHIRQRIIAEAKRMALGSENSLKEIAYNLGFFDSAHFSKFFKSGAGGSFSEYKKQKLTIGLAV